jgi:SNF2 family DNA or RNA helicase
LPPRVALLRNKEVPDELWHALARNIAPAATDRPSDDEVRVPLERFLARRLWIGQLLQDHGCGISLDGPLGELLGRSAKEKSEVASALAGSVDLVSFEDVHVLLEQGRFQRSLKPFQERDLAKVLALSHGANFSVPGAGKTTVAYALYEIERLRGRVDRLLVVAPLSAFDAWFTEAEFCLNPPPKVARLDKTLPKCEVLLVNYQRLARRYDEIARWVLGRPCHVILDEAHRMKRGRGGEWGSACLDLAHLAVRRDILTGTPAPQHPTDFIALLDFLWPHQATQVLPRAAQQPNPPDTVMTQISTRLNPLFVRTRKDELGLDPPKLRVELVSMKPLQAEIYAALRSRMRRALAGTQDHAALARLGQVVAYLLEAATNPGLLAPALSGTAPAPMAWPPQPLPPNSQLIEKVASYASFETPRKFEKLAALVASNANAGRKTLVWSNFVGNLIELAERLLVQHEPALIYGAIPSGDEDADYVTRERELRRFRTDPKCQVLIANPAAMSEGVSLHETCHDAIYLDRTFNAGQYLQSLDRIHRLGLPPETETRITFLVSEGTIDEVVDARVRTKAERLALMLSDPNLVTMALPDDEAYGEWIDPEDLDALLQHLRNVD